MNEEKTSKQINSQVSVCAGMLRSGQSPLEGAEEWGSSSKLCLAAPFICFWFIWGLHMQMFLFEQVLMRIPRQYFKIFTGVFCYLFSSSRLLNILCLSFWAACFGYQSIITFPWKVSNSEPPSPWNVLAVEPLLPPSQGCPLYPLFSCFCFRPWSFIFQNRTNSSPMSCRVPWVQRLWAVSLILCI